uniref:Phosphoglycerate mutase (2,3-diphosphoglycerate-dependent) n=1 Tax=Pseudo-nitzschia australis TaxID=44445 RepID=A0A7S4EM38_9STRA|mmetsp:Transcript_9084/g.19638  ORF Transcript_9084/g.19638 Transcript_9084/m.19638 type:complete len:384 (+) Transcript_9084:162-1313(+)
MHFFLGCSISSPLVGLVILLAVISVEAFFENFGGAIERRLPRSLTVLKALDQEILVDGEGHGIVRRVNDSVEKPVDRRAAIRNAIAISAAIAVSDTFRPYANAGELPSRSNIDHTVELDCLKDLPPISEDSIRIYFCRHGQTENNRLRIVQGARVDPPVNINGKAQATNLGLALARADPKPELFFSSSLLRAKMTANIAANANNDTLEATSSSNRLIARQLPVLSEIDFGAFADGQPISVVQEKMTKTYIRWSMGDVDYRPEGDGDSGREVLIRAVEAIETLVNEAKAADVPCVAAVSHSAYLRVIVGMVLNEPLLQSSIRKIRNGSVTVIDVPKNLSSTMIGPKPNLLGGWLSRKPKDFTLSIPTCKTIRINEFRHLPLDVI